MGLELVSIAMEVEREFKVRLRDDVGSRVQTVADLAMLVASLMSPRSDACLTARTFFRLRPVLQRETGLTRSSIRPSTPIADVIQTDVRRIWQALHAIDRNVPRLVTSPVAQVVFQIIFVVMAILGFGAVAWVWWHQSAGSALLAVLGVLVMLGLIAYGFTRVERRVANRVPAYINTVGDLVHAVTPPGPRHDQSGARLLMQIEVLERVRRIVAQELSLKIEEVRPESRLVEDLRCG